MAVVLKNEGTKDFYFDDGTSRKKTILSPGSIATVSDNEFQSVPISMRGQGAINVLYPDDTTSSSSKINMDWETVLSTSQLVYFGVNRQDAADADQTWTIKYFKYVQAPDSTIKVSQIQVLEQVAWTDRTILPWS